jgi:hypothetical protein
MTVSGATCVCSAGYTSCTAGSCVNLLTNASNCGTCGHVCPGNAVSGQIGYCNGSGGCALKCPGGEVLCGGVCVPSPCEPACFVAGTPVTMADGSTKAIEAIVAGDRVLAMDPATRSLAAATVSYPIAHPTTPELLRINGRLTTTPDHRFFVAGEWVHAIDLRIGEALVLAQPGEDGFTVGAELVTQLELLPGGVPTYNLEVDELHDYFAGGVLVHNLKN